MNALDWTPLVIYTLALTLIPGPSALLVAASGARFGLARCVPHLAGSVLGYEVQLLAAARGASVDVLRDPVMQTAMHVASTIYLLWMCWRVLRAQPATTTTSSTTPLRWHEAVVLQVANPKSWLTAMASAGLYLPSASTPVEQGAFMFYAGAAGFTGLAFWAATGAALQRWVDRGSRRILLNRGMASATAVTALWGLRGALAS